MKRTLVALMACTALSLSAQEQKQYPEQETMRPGMSEYWTPQPKIVTPGDPVTHSAPSDAIVLFDGKDLSAWQNTKGEAAGWDVHDGIMTVNFAAVQNGVVLYPDLVKVQVSLADGAVIGLEDRKSVV